jgi:hypothetical protein
MELQDYGTRLFIESRESGNSTGLNSAGEQLELAKSLMSWGHPRRPYLLHIYATAFQMRFQQNGDSETSKSR